MLTFALFVFVTSRILLTGSLIEDRSSQTVLALAAASDVRTEEITPSKNEAEVIEITGEPIEECEEDPDTDENQISIDELTDIPETEPQDAAEELVEPEEEEK